MRFGGFPRVPSLFSNAYIIKSSTKAASMPLVVGTQLKIFLSQQPSANVTRTFSPLPHEKSRPSELQHTSVSLTATLHSCFLG